MRTIIAATMVVALLELAGCGDFEVREIKAPPGAAAERTVRFAGRAAGVQPPLPASAGITRVQGGVRHCDLVCGVAFSPDGTRLASVSRDGTVVLWSAADGKQIAVLRVPSSFHPPLLGGPRCAFSPDGTLLAETGPWPGDSAVRLWSVASRQVVRELNPKRATSACVAFTPDGQTVVAGGNGAVMGWSAQTGEPRWVQETGDNETLGSVALSPDGVLLAYTHLNTVRLLPTADLGKRTPASLLAETGMLLFTHVACDRDGTRLVSGSAGAATATAATVQSLLRLWSVRTGLEDRCILAPPDVVFSAAALSPDATVLACACVTWSRQPQNRQVSIHTLDAATGRELRTVRGPAMQLAFSPDGKLLAATGGVAMPDPLHGQNDLWTPSRVVGLFRADTLESHSQITSTQRAVSFLAFSADGKALLTGGRDGTVKGWSIETGKELVTFAGHAAGKGAGGGPDQGVLHIATSPDGGLVASVCGSVTKLWSIADGREVLTLGTDGPMRSLRVPFFGPTSSALFSPDGKTVACASAATQTLTLFAAESGRQRHAWYLPYRFALLGFSADGRALLTHNANGSTYALTLPPDPN